MVKIKILYIGKSKEQWLIDALSEYEKRLLGTLFLEWICLKDTKELEMRLSAERSYCCLDPCGKSYSSEAFSSFIFTKSSHVFVIGGAEGIPSHLKRECLSFSKMTFTHQMIRLLLIEQLYRADQIYRNTPYHK